MSHPQTHCFIGGNRISLGIWEAADPRSLPGQVIRSARLRGFAGKRIIDHRNPKTYCYPTLRIYRHHKEATVEMSHEVKKDEQDELKEKKKNKDEENELPPPPEKPLPGDCCGSGCVRCVWDIYYEELEDYNNHCKSKSETNPKPS